MANAQQVNGRFKRHLLQVARHPPLSKRQVLRHTEVRKQRGLLKNITQSAQMGWHKDALCVVLPNFAVDGDEVAPGGAAQCDRLLQAGNGAQAGGFARAGRTKQCGDAAAWQRQVNIQREVAQVDLQPHLNNAGRAGACHAGCLSRWLVRALNAYSASSTTNENTSMPPDSQCACAYSSASTWS